MYHGDRAMKKLNLLILLSVISVPLHALKTGGHVTATLISEVEAIQPGQPFTLALKLDMQKDWHTYWINPAESGAPTKMKWDLPRGFKAGAIQWPYPHKIVVPPVTTYGYENEAWLLNEIQVPSTLKPGDRITIKARVDWLECSVECIPGQADVAISLPVSSQMRFDKSVSGKFSNARLQLPIPPGEWKITAAPTDHGFQIALLPPNWFTGTLDHAEFYSSTPGVVEYAKTQTFRKIKNGNYVLNIPPSETDGEPITSLQGVIVVDPGWRGNQSEKAMAIDLPLTGTPVKADDPNIFLPLLFAFLGGLLLNLMPCVLPVLSIKVLSFLNHAPTEKSSVKKQSFAFAFGVVSSFWALAGLLLFLRAGGQQLGWGFQMQSPPFVFALVSLFFLLGLNLLGVFEVGTSLTQLGSVSSAQRGLSGSFLSGALTTLVATPCTAPFMGSALGFAISQPPLISFLIFTALGAGVATPYVLLSYFPRLLTYLPRPGDWMDSLKQFMGFLMLATVLWLLWVLENQKHAVVVPVLGTLLIQGVGAWIFGRWASFGKPQRSKVLAMGMAGGLIFFSLTWGLQIVMQAGAAGIETVEKEDQIQWKPFSHETVLDYRKKGTPVFVDFTASWCLTCQVNERVALNAESVIKAIQAKNIAMLKADWTSYDPKITEALQSFGRNGVPFYLLYSSNPNEAPTPLPEILTPQIVLDALNKLN